LTPTRLIVFVDDQTNIIKRIDLNDEPRVPHIPCIGSSVIYPEFSGKITDLKIDYTTDCSLVDCIAILITVSIEKTEMPSLIYEVASKTWSINF